MISQTNVLAQINKFEDELMTMTSVKTGTSYNYKYIMSQIEIRMEEYLKAVRNLVQECKLDKTAFLDFKTLAINMIHQAAMKRGEYDWANAFEKKFGL